MQMEVLRRLRIGGQQVVRVEHPSACPPQCGQRSTSHPSLCFRPRATPQSGQLSSIIVPVSFCVGSTLLFGAGDNPLDQRSRHGNRGAPRTLTAALVRLQGGCCKELGRAAGVC
jgi:hypothetical protein